MVGGCLYWAPIPTQSNIAVSMIARRPKGGREWFYANSILGIVLLQGPENDRSRR